MESTNPRLKRKRQVCQLKLEKDIPLFNLDDRIKNNFNLPQGAHLLSLLPDLNAYCTTTDASQLPSNRFLERRRKRSKLKHDNAQNQNNAIHNPNIPIAIYKSFKDRLLGNPINTNISPYTLRPLHHYIRRDFESKPLKMCILEEIRNLKFPPRSSRSSSSRSSSSSSSSSIVMKLNLNNSIGDYIKNYRKKNQPHYKRNYSIKIENDKEALPCPQTILQKEILSPLRKCSSIDYQHLSQHLVISVNRLLYSLFWPGIDVKECLEYPDYTIVGLYKELVISCACMTPEGYIMYIGVHPQWQCKGMGSFILYHLIQTVPTRDITLHVSATNNAMILYQKFGFKPEEYIVNFYDKYYSNDSKDSKNAFFLRLRR